jgi:hypothetical protein
MDLSEVLRVGPSGFLYTAGISAARLLGLGIGRLIAIKTSGRTSMTQRKNNSRARAGVDGEATR